MVSTSFRPWSWGPGGERKQRFIWWKHDGILICWIQIVQSNYIRTLVGLWIRIMAYGNYFCLGVSARPWQDLSPWPSASNTASKFPGSLGDGSSEKSLSWLRPAPPLTEARVNSSKLPLAFVKKRVEFGAPKLRWSVKNCSYRKLQRSWERFVNGCQKKLTSGETPVFHTSSASDS